MYDLGKEVFAHFSFFTLVQFSYRGFSGKVSTVKLLPLFDSSCTSYSHSHQNGFQYETEYVIVEIQYFSSPCEAVCYDPFVSFSDHLDTL